MLLAIIHLVKFTFEIIAKTRRVFEFGYAPLSSSAEYFFSYSLIHYRVSHVRVTTYLIELCKGESLDNAPLYLI